MALSTSKSWLAFNACSVHENAKPSSGLQESLPLLKPMLVRVSTSGASAPRVGEAARGNVPCCGEDVVAGVPNAEAKSTDPNGSAVAGLDADEEAAGAANAGKPKAESRSAPEAGGIAPEAEAGAAVAAPKGSDPNALSKSPALKAGAGVDAKVGGANAVENTASNSDLDAALVAAGVAGRTALGSANDASNSLGLGLEKAGSRAELAVEWMVLESRAPWAALSTVNALAISASMSNAGLAPLTLRATELWDDGVAVVAEAGNADAKSGTMDDAVAGEGAAKALAKPASKPASNLAAGTAVVVLAGADVAATGATIDVAEATGASVRAIGSDRMELMDLVGEREPPATGVLGRLVANSSSSSVLSLALSSSRDNFFVNSGLTGEEGPEAVTADVGAAGIARMSPGGIDAVDSPTLTGLDDDGGSGGGAPEGNANAASFPASKALIDFAVSIGADAADASDVSSSWDLATSRARLVSAARIFSRSFWLIAC
ncbi:hypothetical protein BC831DRAFT_451803 [Entophlyctis helioformis]|nr:hypothetical protein BC831DRAFT_451803 [Entophlyctis helioformis]